MCSVQGSTLAREVDSCLFLRSGPEIGVAATKSFTSQLAIIYKIAEKLCDGCIGIDFKKVSQSIENILSDHTKIQDIAKELKDISDIYIIGRGMHHPIAMEAALKLKELT